jgi:hypothetical protein
MNPGQTCENCAAFYALKNECRRKSPVPAPIQGPGGQIGTLGMYPATKKNEWCCEWLAEGEEQA